jgi:hypothetical protein
VRHCRGRTQRQQIEGPIVIFSAHVADTSTLQNLRRRTPAADDVSGLRSARMAPAARANTKPYPSPQLGRECMVACWEDEAAIDKFLADNPTGRVLARGWTARMELIRAVGVWPGLDDDLAAEAGDRSRGYTGPAISITIGTAYLRTAIPFVRVNNGLESQFVDAPGVVWGTLMTNLPQRLVASLTIWENSRATLDYVRHAAHGQAVADHFDPTKDPTGHTFVTGGGFFGFRPLGVTGAVGGKNPLTSTMLTSRME